MTKQKQLKIQTADDARKLINALNLRHYDVAEGANISPFTLSVWLRGGELTDDRKERIMDGIEKCLEQREKDKEKFEEIRKSMKEGQSDAE